MIVYRCDFCDSESASEPKIKLKGFTDHKEAQILLPEQFQERHFCSRGCFIAYIERAIHE